MPRQCPSPEELSGFVLGTMAEDLAGHVSEHVEQCPACEETIQNLEETMDSVVETLRKPDAHDPYTLETGCERVVELVEAIGRDPSRSVMGAGEVSEAEPEELGTIRSYRLSAKLGQGGMGSVYKALHVDLNKVVALKVLSQDRLSDAAAIARFRREMKAVGKLSHPNIVQATDAGEEDGMHYLVMELVDGIDLAKLVQQRGPLPVSEACELIRQSADGLQHAHEHGLVHRDIKPSNLMLETGGSDPDVQSVRVTSPHVKILDLGLALLAGPQAETSGELTTSGQVMGTIDYMAPEQGSDTHNVDIRADVYSLGATLFKLLTGRAPFEGERYRTPIKKLTALANTQPERVDKIRPEIAAELADLVQRMLSKSPEERPDQPADVARLLAPFAVGADLSALGRTDLQSVGDGLQTRPTGAEEDRTTDPTCVGETNEVQPEVKPDPVRRESQVRRGSPDPADTPTEGLDELGRPAVAAVARSGDRATTEGAAIGTATWLERCASRAKRAPLASAAVAIAVLLIPIGLYYSGVLFKVETEHGTLYVELPDGIDDVTVTIDGEQAEIEFLDGKRTIRLSVDSGSRKLVMTTSDGVRLTTENDRYFFEAGGEQTIRAWLEPAGDGALVLTDDVERQVAEWVLSVEDRLSSVEVETADGERSEVTDIVQLPAQPFNVVTVFIHLGEYSVADFEQFAGLTRLEGFHTSGARFEGAALAHLAGLPNLVYLGFRNNPWLDDDDVHVINSLEHVVSLGLDRTSVSGAGLAQLRELRTLRQLDFGPLSETDLASIKQLDQLQHLVLAWEPVTDAGLLHISEMTGLVSLNVGAGSSEISQITDAGVEHLRPLVNLKTLYLSSVHITDRSAAVLAGFEELQTLTLNGTQMTDEGLAQLESLTNLATLNVQGTQITDLALEHIATLQDMERLFLADTGITDAGLAHLEGLTQLRELHLQETDVTAAGVAKLQETLPNCRITSDFGTFGPIYTERSIAEWVLSIGGFVTVAQDGVPDQLVRQGADLPDGPFRVIQINATSIVEGLDLSRIAGLRLLESLNIGYTTTTDADLVHLSGLTTLTGLVLNSTDITGDGLRHLQALSNLSSLHLRGTAVSDAGLEHVTVLENLHLLELIGSHVTGAGLEHLASLPRLHTLRIDGRQFDAEGARHLSRVGSLESLYFSDKNVSDATLEHLSFLEGHESLRVLHLRVTSVTDEGLRRVVDALPELEALYIGGGDISDAGLEHVLGLNDLQSLTLTGLPITDGGVAQLQNLEHLATLGLQGTRVTDACIETLSAMPQLTTRLDLRDTRITADGIAALKSAMPDCSILWSADD